MAKRKMISEILEGASKQDSQVSRGQYLKDKYTVALITILRGGFDDSVVWNLPEGEPPYRKDDAPKGYEMSNLYIKQKMFKHFVKGSPSGDRMTDAKREKLFIGLLESLHADEAELVIAMKDKKLTGRYKGITLKLVQDTFPGLIKTPVKLAPVVKEVKLTNTTTEAKKADES